MQFADDRTGLAGAHTSITIADGLGNPGTVATPYTQPADGTPAGQISAGYIVPTDGTWTVRAKIRDLAGNESDDYTWSFMVDDLRWSPIYQLEWDVRSAMIVDPRRPDGTGQRRRWTTICSPVLA